MRKIVSLGASILVAMSWPCMVHAKEAPKADNTAQNKGAMSKDAVTAQKQGNSKSDVDVVAEIRKLVVGEKELSTDAKNVKILYSKGLVTLIGPVDSEKEKSKIEELAKGGVGVTGVKNMITISPKAH